MLPADVQDYHGAEVVFRRAGSLPRLAKVWADAMYRAFAAWVRANRTWVLEIVTRRPEAVRFEAQAWRWVVERTFGCLGRDRRLSKDYEHNPKSSEAWIDIAMTHRMARYRVPRRDPKWDLLRKIPRPP